MTAVSNMGRMCIYSTFGRIIFHVSFYHILLLWPWNADLSSTLIQRTSTVFLSALVASTRCFRHRVLLLKILAAHPSDAFVRETFVSSRKARQEAWNNISYEHKCLSAKWVAVESTYVMLNFYPEVRMRGFTDVICEWIFLTNYN